MPGIIGQHLPTGGVPNPPLGSSTLILDNSGALKLKRSDGSVDAIGGTSSGNFTYSVDVSANLVTDMTYAEYISALNIGVTPSYYRITDFKTKGYILGGDPGHIYTGVTESLIIFASGTHSFPYALSEAYPQDEVYYDPYDTNWKNDLSFSVDGSTMVTDFKGVIYYRKDTKRDISASYDWRNSEIRRWKHNESAMGIATWSAGTYSQGDFVYDDNGAMYYCISDHSSPGGTGPGSLNPNTYYSTNDFGYTASNINRQNVHYNWVRLWLKDLYLLPAWGFGLTVSATYSMGPLKLDYYSGSADTYIEIPIDLTDYQDFNLFSTQGASQSINNDVNGFHIKQPNEVIKKYAGSIVLTNRVDTLRPVFECEIFGTGVTIYDRLPVLPGSILNNNINFAYNRFRDTTDTIMYGDQYVTSLLSDVDPSWQSNTFYYDNYIFGFAQGCDITSNIASFFEESVIIKGIYYGSVLRTCTLLNVSNIMLGSYIYKSNNTQINVSNNDVFMTLDESIVADSADNLFEITYSIESQNANNEFGPGFESNLIGPGGINDTLISSNFDGNYFYGIQDSNIEAMFQRNIGASGSFPALDDVFKENNVGAQITDMDFKNSTHIYDTYTCDILRTPNNTKVLRYVDNLLVQQIVGATA